MQTKGFSEMHIRCPFRDCREMHEIRLDKNSKPYVLCKYWGVNLWFYRGEGARVWWKEHQEVRASCPACHRDVPDDNDGQCPHCNELWSPCVDCGLALNEDEDFCKGCGWQGADESRNERRT